MDQNTLDEKRQRRSELNKQNAERRKAVEDAMVAQYPPAPGAVGKEVQFFHDRFYGRTYAVVAPDGDTLRAAAMRLLGGGKEVVVNVMLGVSSLNVEENDQYNKRIGRAVASSKLSTVSMKLVSVNLYENISHFSVELDGLRLDFSIQKNPNVPYLGYVNKNGLKSVDERRKK